MHKKKKKRDKNKETDDLDKAVQNKECFCAKTKAEVTLDHEIKIKKKKKKHKKDKKNGNCSLETSDSSGQVCGILKEMDYPDKAVQNIECFCAKTKAEVTLDHEIKIKKKKKKHKKDKKNGNCSLETSDSSGQVCGTLKEMDYPDKAVQNIECFCAKTKAEVILDNKTKIKKKKKKHKKEKKDGNCSLETSDSFGQVCGTLKETDYPDKAFQHIECFCAKTKTEVILDNKTKIKKKKKKHKQHKEDRNCTLETWDSFGRVSGTLKEVKGSENVTATCYVKNELLHECDSDALIHNNNDQGRIVVGKRAFGEEITDNHRSYGGSKVKKSKRKDNEFEATSVTTTQQKTKYKQEIDDCLNVNQNVITQHSTEKKPKKKKKHEKDSIAVKKEKDGMVCDNIDTTNKGINKAVEKTVKILGHVAFIKTEENHQSGDLCHLNNLNNSINNSDTTAEFNGKKKHKKKKKSKKADKDRDEEDNQNVTDKSNELNVVAISKGKESNTIHKTKCKSTTSGGNEHLSEIKVNDINVSEKVHRKRKKRKCDELTKGTEITSPKPKCFKSSLDTGEKQCLNVKSEFTCYSENDIVNEIHNMNDDENHKAKKKRKKEKKKKEKRKDVCVKDITIPYKSTCSPLKNLNRRFLNKTVNLSIQQIPLCSTTDSSQVDESEKNSFMSISPEMVNKMRKKSSKHCVETIEKNRKKQSTKISDFQEPSFVSEFDRTLLVGHISDTNEPTLVFQNENSQINRLRSGLNRHGQSSNIDRPEFLNSTPFSSGGSNKNKLNKTDLVKLNVSPIKEFQDVNDNNKLDSDINRNNPSQVRKAGDVINAKVANNNDCDINSGESTIISDSDVEPSQNSSIIPLPEDVSLAEEGKLTEEAKLLEGSALTEEGVSPKKESTDKSDDISDAQLADYLHQDNHILSKVMKDLFVQYRDQIKTGRWTSDEENQLRQNWNAYFEAHPHPNPVLFICSKDIENIDDKQDIKSIKRATNFWLCIGKGIVRSTYSIYKRCTALFASGKRNIRYTQEEDALLLELFAKYGAKWKFIGEELGRTGQSVEDRYKKIKLKNKLPTSSSWESDEDEQLKKALKTVYKGRIPSKHSGITWQKVAVHMTRRTSDQCRERWLNTLTKPVIFNKTFMRNWRYTVRAEDQIHLIEMISKEGWKHEQEIDWNIIRNAFSNLLSSVTLATYWKNLKRLYVKDYLKKSLPEIIADLKCLLPKFEKKADGQKKKGHHSIAKEKENFMKCSLGNLPVSKEFISSSDRSDSD